MSSASKPFKRLRRFILLLAVPFCLSTLLSAAEEACLSCGGNIQVTGDFSHGKEILNSTEETTTQTSEGLLEDIHGPEFFVTIRNLPAGNYTLEIVAVETHASQAKQRVFSVMAGDKVLAKDKDLYREAGGRNKAVLIRGQVEKSDDALRGPLKLTFTATTGAAKFNLIRVLSAEGATVAQVKASELADVFSAAALKVPEVNKSPVWRNPETPLKERLDDLISRLSLAEKIAQLGNAAPAIPRLGLPAYDYWNEALHGVANNGVATVFPQAIGGAASWNPALFHEQGRIIGVEGRAKYNDYSSKNQGNSKWWTGLTFWTPNINIFRDPRWGRGQETYGEDPHLTSELGIEFVRGLQGDHPDYMLAMACVKHFAVHSGPEADRHRFNAKVSERDLYETYLPQFERVVKEAKVAGVMSAYNAINGTPASADAFLLKELLRRQWGFDGYVVSDCEAIRDIYGENQHHYVSTPEEAAALAIKAGCNLCCGGDYNALVRAVQQGLVTEKEVDQALYHTLWTRFRLGLFDPADKVPHSKYTLQDNDTPEHGRVALELARQSIVLLKNDGVLPLSRTSLKRIAVIGPNSQSTSMLEGNYHGSASRPVSILAGIRQVAGPDVVVTCAMGSPITSRKEIAPWSGQDNTTTRPLAELKEEALQQARLADIIIYVGGLTAAQEGESFDREGIELPPEQTDLLRALHATGKPLVLVNCSGSAIALPWEHEHLNALLQAWYPGQEGGRAVAEILFGEVNPSGHLPITFYRSTADLPSFTDYSMRQRTYRYFEGKPLYAFGHGLSYTQFAYPSARLSKDTIRPGEDLALTVTVANTGRREGSDVVQLYYRHLSSSVTQPRQALCGFARVQLKPGESRELCLAVSTERLRYWDEKEKRYTIAPGKYELLIGAASDDIRQNLAFTIAPQ